MIRGLRRSVLTLGLAALMALACGPAGAADTTRVDRATKQVEKGAKEIGEGKVGQGVEDTAKGIGNTVVEGAKFTGDKFKEAGQAAEPPAQSAWQRTKEGAASFGASVKNFFNKLFGN